MRNPQQNILFPQGVTDYLQRWRNTPDVNYEVLSVQPRVLLYTSKRIPSTGVGSKIYLQRAGEIMNARANVQGAPSSTLTWDILKNGVSIFSSKPTISAGQELGNATPYIENSLLVEDDYLQVQITAVGGATGPLMVWLEWTPMGEY